MNYKKKPQWDVLFLSSFFKLTSSCVFTLVRRSLQFRGTSLMSTSVMTISSGMAGTGTLGAWNTVSTAKTMKFSNTPLDTIYSSLFITFASNGGGVKSFPFAINMAFILAAMAAAISTPPWGFPAVSGGSDMVLFGPAVLRTPDRGTEWAEFSLLSCGLTSALCLGWAGLSHRLLRHL